MYCTEMKPSFYAKPPTARTFVGHNGMWIINLTFVALWTREMLLQTFVVGSLSEEIIVLTFVERKRIEVHEMFIWPSFV